MIKDLWRKRWFIISLPWTIYFNFKTLPFRQAIKLPIWLCKPKLFKISGGVYIDCDDKDISSGMIKIGLYYVRLYPNTGCMIDLKGKVIFRGNCLIGNNSFIDVGKNAVLEFGEDFKSTTSLRIACYNSIKFGHHVLVGWDCTFMDSDFHSLTRSDGSKNKGYAPVTVGDEVWFGYGCKILKGSFVPSKSVVSANTIVSSRIVSSEYSVLGNANQIEILKTGCYRNYRDDRINYE